MAIVIAFAADSEGSLTIQRLDRADLAGLGDLLPVPEGLDAMPDAPPRAPEPQAWRLGA